MSNINLTIGGRKFAVACAPGEEDHVAALGRMIDSRVSGMGDAGKATEARMLLFGALLLADELHEAQLGRGDSASSQAAEPAQAGSPAQEATSELLTQIALRLENLADRLEQLADSP